MKILLSFFVILFLLPSSTQKWKADTAKSKVSFSLPKGGNESGSFNLSEAIITYDSVQLSACNVTAVVDVKSISTGDDGKNAHLLSEEFFDAEKFSAITFKSSRFFQKNGIKMVEGKLQIKSVIKKINFPFHFRITDEGGIFTAQFEILAGDFGVMKKSKTGADKVLILLEIPVVKE